MASLRAEGGVAGTAPVMLQDAEGRVLCLTMEDLFAWFHSTLVEEGSEQQAVRPEGWKVWSDGGFVPMRALTRRATLSWRPRMWRVLTHTACVDVVEDQVLLTADGQGVRAGDVAVGDTLAHAEGPGVWAATHGFPVSPGWKRGYLYGAFYAVGTCGTYWNRNKRKTYAWSMAKRREAWLQKLRDYAMATAEADGFRGCMFRVHRWKVALSGPGARAYVQHARRCCYHTDKTKRVPEDVLNGSPHVQLGFIRGYCAGAGSRTTTATGRFATKGPVGAMGLLWVMKKAGYGVSLHLPPSSPLYHLGVSATQFHKDPHGVKKKIDLGYVYREWVYVLTTDNGVFCAGVGTLLCGDMLYVAP